MTTRILAINVVFLLAALGVSGWSETPTQYHIQTDEGPERYFRYQTLSGQYRKEKRLEDGTVVGTYGWVDPNGYLRLRDYVADNSGYRVLKSKVVFVGKDGPAKVDTGSPIDNSIQSSSVNTARFPAGRPSPIGFTAADPDHTVSAAPVTVVGADYSPEDVKKSDSAVNAAPALPASNTPETQISLTQSASPSFSAPVRPPFSASARPSYFTPYYQNSVVPQYDEVSVYHNGFRYYLPRQYHEEETRRDGQRDGSFGYIDPFGIRRVVYYNAGPGGFVHRKNNRYVGFSATPYDPRF